MVASHSRDRSLAAAAELSKRLDSHAFLGSRGDALVARGCPQPKTCFAPAARQSLHLPCATVSSRCRHAGGLREGFAVAPLNPAYTAAEFDFYVKDLCPKLMLFAGAAKTSASKIEHERAGWRRPRSTRRGPQNAADVPLAEVVLRDDWASLHPSTTGGASHITASGAEGSAEEAASMSRLALRLFTPLPWLQPLHAFGSTGDARHRHRLARPSDAALMLHTQERQGDPSKSL